MGRSTCANIFAGLAFRIINFGTYRHKSTGTFGQEVT